jgi:ribosome-binding ATPase YchF (GTP1/OBG family)
MWNNELSGNCKIELIEDFGQCSDNNYVHTQEEIEEFLTNLETSYYSKSRAMFLATTNSQQIEAIRALTNLGWRYSNWTKAINSIRMVRVWWKVIGEDIEGEILND